MARLALLSVSDKTGIIELARTLVEEFQFDLISSGGTAKALQGAGLPVTKVSDYTGHPEILGGRVKTLHPRIHGGILARRDIPQDITDMENNSIRPIDLVVVNLYPFEETIAKPNVTVAEAIEQIDIGGPAMLRAAAKNYPHLTVLCNPNQYQAYLAQLRQQSNSPTIEFRQTCAIEAFSHTATYDSAIATYLSTRVESGFFGVGNRENITPSVTPSVTPSAAPSAAPSVTSVTPSAAPSAAQSSLFAKKIQPLTHGENPHQPAAWQ
ncbi:hypothetical protein [Limnofasciculus baicalensis]|uniref:MGS-like domain-containing protein n=1 Tax=Limnofasciculus baicalensis BBK-W-15 TaxID=2699891 RepID=A0AAE3H1H5_9CYAN|nr:hypothetical protein [Limnofasciculus baicalensis]MCP2732502.1 hypothetical protein [Limnofasciculus baicalensis BBK-W-15]